MAAFVGEPIHGAGGVFYPTDDYWPLVREICTRHDVLLIDDEIITGFCRTGRWFGLSHWNVTPDILSFAKGVTSGYLPLGGIMVTRAIKEVDGYGKPDDRWMHAYTYSGHPTCCAVALKNIEIMERERLAENAAADGRPAHKPGSRRRSAICRTPATSAAARGCLPPSSSSRIARRRRISAGDLKFAATLQAEMMKRGVITRTRPRRRPSSGAGRRPVLRAAAGRHRSGDRSAGRRWRVKRSARCWARCARSSAAAGAEFRPATPDDAAALASFSDGALHLPADAPLLARKHLAMEVLVAPDGLGRRAQFR